MRIDASLFLCNSKSCLFDFVRKENVLIFNKQAWFSRVQYILQIFRSSILLLQPVPGV